MLPLPSFDEHELLDLIEVARTGGHADEDVASLARHLAASGIAVDWPLGLRTADVASTGGPGSLSTLLAPIGLVAGGCTVVKLAVTGRPAGAIDTLGTLPGYRTRSTIDEVRETVATVGFAHFLADERFAPLDARLFALRKKVGAIAVPELAIASLLAKKIAVGVRTVGLDVRVGRYGNMGGTLDEARHNAAAFCRVAKLVGVDAVAFLSSADDCPQPWIGRGESLLALAAALEVRPVPDPWLQEHVLECLRMAETIGGSTDHLEDAFNRHLAAQGSSTDSFKKRVDEVAAAQRFVLKSPTDGTLALDLGCLREVIVQTQAGADGEFSDPVGVRLLVRPGQHVVVGTPIAAVRCGEPAAENIVAAIATAFTVTNEMPPPHHQMEVVRA